jgi:sugar (pentulose or hexulose) kinase
VAARQVSQAEVAAARQSSSRVYTLMDAEAAESPVGANRLVFLRTCRRTQPALEPERARRVHRPPDPAPYPRDMQRAVLEGVTLNLN